MLSVTRQLFVCVLLLLTLPVFGQKHPVSNLLVPRVTRGPYLQLGTATNMIVRWHTAFRTAGFVHYGLTQNHLNFTVGAAGDGYDHIALLSDLSPGTKYYYAIGDGKRSLPAGPFNYFKTAPATNSTDPIRVWVLGDPGTDLPVQRAVRDVYYRYPGSLRTDLVLALGDNAYNRGSYFDYNKSFFDAYREMFRHAAVWPTLGNHDAKSVTSKTQSGPYYELFTLPTEGEAGGAPSGTEAYYSLDYGNIHFVCLNSEDVDLTKDGPMLTWLRKDLAANRKQWTIAFWHQCPYSKGSHDSDSDTEKDQHMTLMRENAVPILEAAGTDLVLCGHSHLYERSFPVRGHYGKSTTLQPGMILDHGDGTIVDGGAYRMGGSETGAIPGKGTIYVNTGSAGHATPVQKLHGLNHPIMCVSLNEAGSFILDIEGGRIEAKFLTDKGVVADSFTMLKGEK